MTVHLYTVCKDEARMLPFFFRHYDPWVSRYVVYDDDSSDDSLEQLERHSKVEVRTFRRSHPESFVESERTLFESCWKESRGQAQWVALVNIDELLYHPDLPRFLAESRRNGYTALPAVGYQMVSSSFPSPPEPLTQQVRDGMRWNMMDKLCLFDPDAIETPQYSEGRHRANPTGELRMPEPGELLLLHYKYLGLDYLTQRLESLRPGFGPVDRKRNWGHKYFWEKAQVEADFETVRRNAGRVV